jgi:uncharacterized repeat protein (TIGR04138 family)
VTGDFQERLQAVLKRDTRYPAIAYAFVLEALERTMKALGRDRCEGEARHVTGPELLNTIADLAREEFGLLARGVLAVWGIGRTEDFGEIVFNLVEGRLLSRRDQDRKEDFRAGFEFDAAFDRDYRIDVTGLKAG